VAEPKREDMGMNARSQTGEGRFHHGRAETLAEEDIQAEMDKHKPGGQVINSPYVS
jgi:hypothetical protein